MFAGYHDLNDHSNGCFLCSLHLFKEAQVSRMEPGGGGGGRGLRPCLHFGGERELHRLFSADYVV